MMLNRRAKPVYPARSFVAEPLERRQLLNAADLDTTFGTGGYASAEIVGIAPARALAAAVQSDGKVVVVGYAQGAQREMIVTRQLVGGSLDSTFGIGGQVLLAPGTFDTASAVAIQPNGKIVIAGSSGTNQFDFDFVVARLNTNGTLDTTFNTTGIETGITGIGASVPTSVAVQTDGKIVIGGVDGNAFGDTHFELARVNANGGVDTTFGAAGHVVTPITTGFNSVDSISAITLDSSSRIVAAGVVGTGQGGGPVFGLARYTTTGALDTTLGTTGIVTTQVGTVDSAAAVVIQSDGKIVVGGSANYAMAALRYTSAGALDPSFAAGGRFVSSTSATGKVPTCVTMGVLSTGAIILGGSAPNSSFFDQPTVIRLTSTGALDPSHPMSQNGSKLNLFGGVVDSSGNVELVGSVWNITDSEIAQTYTTQTFLANGATGGTIVTSFFALPEPTTATSSLMQPDGKLLVSGWYRNAISGLDRAQGFIARYNVNGTLDTSFGASGIALIANAGTSEVDALAVQSGGAIVYAATMTDGASSTRYVSIGRLLANGLADSSFGFGAPLRLADNSPSSFTASAILQQSDGSLLIEAAGDTGVVLKLTAAGKVDTTYGNSGRANSFGGTTGAIDSSGRLVVAFYNRIYRYLANGNYDTSFNGPTLGGVTWATGSGAMVFQPDGKFLVAGLQANQPLIARFNNDGTPDLTFATQGFATLTNVNASFAALSLLASGNIVAVASATSILVAAFDASGTLIPSFGSAGVQLLPLQNAFSAGIAVRANGKIDLIGTNYPTAIIAQLQGAIPSNTISGTSGNDAIILTRDANGTHIDWQSGALVGQMNITDAAGLTINGNGGSDIITLVGTNGNAIPNALHLNGTFTLNGLAGVNTLVKSTLDIGRSTVYVTYAGAASDPLATLRGYLQNGYAAGLWTGAPTATTGVITSATAAGNTTRTTGIAYADSAEGLLPLPANTIELKYTLYGDIALAGSVTFTDFMRMTQHYTLATNQTWGKGDFNYDGSVDANDFNLLQPNFGQALPAPIPAMTPIVATPVTASIPTQTVIDPAGAATPITSWSTGDASAVINGTAGAGHKAKVNKAHQKRH